MKAIGVYLRVSTLDQSKGIESQERALKDYCNNQGFENIIWYKDKLSGKDTNRPAFQKLQRDIFNGKVDTVICWKLDRLSRSLQDGVNVLCEWLKRDIRIISVTQQLDFSGLTGQLVASVLFALAALERENLRENTKRGIAAARARGAKLGKRPKLFAKNIIPLIEKGHTILEVSERLGKTKQAIYNCLKREGIELSKVKRQANIKTL